MKRSRKSRSSSDDHCSLFIGISLDFHCRPHMCLKEGGKAVPLVDPPFDDASVRVARAQGERSFDQGYCHASPSQRLVGCGRTVIDERGSAIIRARSFRWSVQS